MLGQGGGFRDESERMGGNHLKIWCVVGIGTGKSSGQGRQNCSEFKSVDRSGKIKRQRTWGTSLVVQWLRLLTSTAEGMGLIPGRGTKSLHAIWHSKKKKKKKNVGHRVILIIRRQKISLCQKKRKKIILRHKELLLELNPS